MAKFPSFKRITLGPAPALRRRPSTARNYRIARILRVRPENIRRQRHANTFIEPGITAVLEQIIGRTIFNQIAAQTLFTL